MGLQIKCVLKSTVGGGGGGGGGGGDECKDVLDTDQDGACGPLA